VRKSLSALNSERPHVGANIENAPDFSGRAAKKAGNVSKRINAQLIPLHQNFARASQA
jgi:hypothetical protein